MEPTLIIALVLAVLVGVSLGLLGGGGSILTVPILTYLVGMEPRDAIAASLFIVGVTSAVSVFSHAKAARVRWKTGLIFGAAGMVGAFAGGFAGGYIPGAVLMLLFAAMMIATATAMIRGRKPEAARVGAASTSPGFTAAAIGSSTNEGGGLHASEVPDPVASITTTEDGGGGNAHKKELPLLRILLDGFAVGIATGLVGAGGGFLVVPALNLLGGLPMAIAVGTSLLVIAMKSFAGLSGYLFSAHIDWPVVLGFTALAVAGSFIGARLAGMVPERTLRKGFGWFVLAMGAFVLLQEVPQLVGGLA